MVARVGPAGPLTVDSAGAVYIGAESRVDRYGLDGSVTTVAGGGTTPVDDGVGARAARFDGISSLSLDDRGGLYVGTDDRVMRVDGVAAPAAVPGAPCESFDRPAWAWGWNGVGQLGGGTTLDRRAPVRVAGSAPVSSVSGGTYHSLAVLRDGRVTAWGWNGYGQLGDGTTTQRTVPVVASGLSGAKSVSAGAFHSLALGTDGTVWAWGWNYFGQLGDASSVDRHTPVRTYAMPWPRAPQIAVSAGAYHSVSLGSNGLAYAWGRNGYGQLGTAYAGDEAVPTEVATFEGVAGIGAGGVHTAATWTSSP